MSRRPDVLIGSELPRIFTKPLRKLTPATSNGFAVVEFVDQLRAAGAKDDAGRPLRLMPWQKQALVRALELREDGTYRFRVVLILVARQNGKTTLLKILTLWRMLHDNARTVVGTSTNMEYAREAWDATVRLAADRDRYVAAMRARTRFADLGGADLDEDRELLSWLPPRDRWVQWVSGPAPAKYGALDTSLKLRNGHRYKIATASRTGGRSLSIDLGLADELREHRSKGENDTGWEAWAALDGATTARPNSQMYGLSNAGDDGSVVLNHLRAAAIDFIETGEGDESTLLLEWSAPDGCDVSDRKGWRMANPALGHGTITEATLASKSRLPAHVFRTEHLCQGVPTLRVAVQGAWWQACEDQAVTLNAVRRNIAVVLDVSPDLSHVSLVAAGVDDDGHARTEVQAAWGSPDEMRGPATQEGSLAWWLRKLKPRKVGWFPDGPAAAIATDMAALAKRHPVVELRGAEVGQACQGLAEQSKAGKVRHRGDPLQTNHVLGANKLNTGDGWRFVRRGAGHVDCAYATAGAVHLARMLPRRPKNPSMVTAA